MGKILAILFFGIVIAAAATAALSAPIVRSMYDCHELYIDESDEIGFRARAQGYAKKSVCQLEQQAIFNLDQCLTGAVEKRKMPEVVHSFAREVLPIVRPMTPSLNMLKERHDDECVDYPTTMFNPPY